MSGADKAKPQARKKMAQLANDLFLAGQVAAPKPVAKARRSKGVTAAEVNAYLRSLPRVTAEELARGTA